MIIRCPSCNERISNKNQTCPHCELDLTGSGDGLSYDDVMRRKNRDANYRLAMHSYGALGLTTVGAIWSWAAADQMSQGPGNWPLLTLAAGGTWYIVVRLVMLVRKIRNR